MIFFIAIDLYLNCALLIDVITRHKQDEALFSMLFAEF